MARALLAEKVGVSDQMIYAYETAAHLPRADVFMAICTEFGVRPRDMLAEDDVENGPSAEEALRSLAKHFGYRLVRI